MIAFKVRLEKNNIPFKIKRFRFQLTDFGKLHKRIGIKALSEISKQFKSNGDHFGTPWAPLEEATKKRRRKNGNTAQILRDTGLLRNGFSYKASPQMCIVGTAVEYSKYHQFSKEQKNRKKRPILPEDQDVINEKITKPVYDDWTKEAMRKIKK